MKVEISADFIAEKKYRYEATINDTIIGWCKASVDNEKYNNICIYKYSESFLELLGPFADIVHLPVYIETPTHFLNQNQVLLTKASPEEVDKTIWWSKEANDDSSVICRVLPSAMKIDVYLS